jgi:FkbM family methyltransferase
MPLLTVASNIRKVIASESLSKLVASTFSNDIPSRGLRIRTDNAAVGSRTAAELFFRLYERHELALIRRTMLTEYDVLELGAGIGVTGAHILRRIEPKRRLVSVEASADLLPTLRTNLDRYRDGRETTIVHGALSYSGSERVELHQSANHTFSKIGTPSASDTAVKAFTLADLVRDNALARYVLVSDIEGAERDLIAQDASALESCQQLIIELHGTDAEIQQMFSNLTRLGFDRTAFRKSICVFSRTTA